MILVYTPQITSRIRYIFSQVFQQLLQKDLILSDKVEEFIAHKGPKLSYAKQPLGSEFFIRSHGLLSAQNIARQDIVGGLWEGLPCFFKTDEQAAIPFDLFAASFYLLTRYEEYAPLWRPSGGGFPYSSSLAFKQHFLQLPIVDLWAGKLIEKLRLLFPELSLPQRDPQCQQLIVVDELYLFKSKGFIRTVGGYLEDLTRLDFVRLLERSLCLSRLRKDPYDNGKYLIRIAKKYGLPSLAFYAAGAYGQYDKNISPLLKKFEILVKHLSDYFKPGYLVSYQASDQGASMEREKRRLSEALKREVKHAQFHLLQLRFPDSYRHLIEIEIAHDYSMGYFSHYGYRAGTAQPFYFYDLEHEQRTPLLLHPFMLSDDYLRRLFIRRSDEEVRSFLNDLIQPLKQVKGDFSFAVHAKHFGEYERWIGWRRSYESSLETIKNAMNQGMERPTD